MFFRIFRIFPIPPKNKNCEVNYFKVKIWIKVALCGCPHLPMCIMIVCDHVRKGHRPHDPCFIHSNWLGKEYMRMNQVLSWRRLLSVAPLLPVAKADCCLVNKHRLDQKTVVSWRNEFYTCFCYRLLSMMLKKLLKVDFSRDLANYVFLIFCIPILVLQGLICWTEVIGCFEHMKCNVMQSTVRNP